jgi:hypothetical protein
MSVICAAAISLRQLYDENQKDPSRDNIIIAGINSERWALLPIQDRLRTIERTAKGNVRKLAAAALEKMLPNLLDSDAEIQQIGIANVVDIGQENVYLEKDGVAYYFKPGNTDDFTVGIFDFTNVTVFGEHKSPTHILSRHKPTGCFRWAFFSLASAIDHLQ